MLQDEFKQLNISTVGKSPEVKVYSIPQSIFQLPSKEKAQALKELEEDFEYLKRKGN